MIQETLDKLEQAFVNGCTIDEACLFAGITKPTLYTYFKENPDYRERVDTLRHHPKLKARFNIVKEIEDGKVETSKWYLERKAKDEFSLRQEMTGAEGKDLVIKITSYGDQDTLSMATRETPNTSITEPIEVQGDSVAQEGSQDDTSS